MPRILRLLSAIGRREARQHAVMLTVIAVAAQGRAEDIGALRDRLTGDDDEI